MHADSTIEAPAEALDFTAWLRRQLHRDDPVGDVALYNALDPCWPAGASLIDLERYMHAWAGEQVMGRVELLRAWPSRPGVVPSPDEFRDWVYEARRRAVLAVREAWNEWVAATAPPGVGYVHTCPKCEQVRRNRPVRRDNNRLCVKCARCRVKSCRKEVPTAKRGEFVRCDMHRHWPRPGDCWVKGCGERAHAYGNWCKTHQPDERPTPAPTPTRSTRRRRASGTPAPADGGRNDDPVERLCHALERRGLVVRAKYGGGFMAQCPAHDDNNPSLSVDAGVNDETGELKALVKCFAGCDTADVMDRLDMTTADLYARRAPAERERSNLFHRTTSDLFTRKPSDLFTRRPSDLFTRKPSDLFDRPS